MSNDECRRKVRVFIVPIWSSADQRSSLVDMNSFGRTENTSKPDPTKQRASSGNGRLLLVQPETNSALRAIIRREPDDLDTEPVG